MSDTIQITYRPIYAYDIDVLAVILVIRGAHAIFKRSHMPRFKYFTDKMNELALFVWFRWLHLFLRNSLYYAFITQPTRQAPWLTDA